MINPRFAQINQITCILPKLVQGNPTNIWKLNNLMQVLTKIDEIQVKKILMFFVIIFAINAVMFGYISILVIVWLQPLKDLGELFVIYAFFNLFENFFYLIIMLELGSSLNKLDHIYKKNLIRINRELSELRCPDNSKSMYKDEKGKVYILKEV